MNWLPFIVSGLGIGAVYALSGVGLVLLYRTSGVLNFAFGAIGAFGAFVTFECLALNVPLVLAALAGIGASVLLSCAYGRVIAPMLAYRETVIRSVGTLGFALIVLGVMGLIWGEIPRRIQYPTDRMAISLFGARLTYTRLIALAVAGGTIIGLSLLISRTRLGLNMRALSDDRDQSAILGVPVLRVEFLAWMIAGVFAGVTGLLLANLIGLKAAQLTFLVVPAIAAALLGGMQSLLWTGIAGLAIGITEAMLIVFPAIAPFRTVSPFAIALLAILVTAALASLPRKSGS
ncbi:branched-chain amino acid ABC transporter permease [Cognatishimia sp. SS12]|uniref:branched-chain amino acid ABC transporter permease n=1 Tax=Cognatishimia sp. SS12 TaxID=2979465 RepID=UPI00232D5B33|nr:branched-chain amino acid ABC transporter permease [Cognatishimia sp. SS12]MDC0739334.1 branched-chain amino acid ABC transporter permease [Cognatishimia sp. SS12]